VRGGAAGTASEMATESTAPDCSVQRHDGHRDAASARQGSSAAAQQPTHEVFGDVNLGAAMLFLMLLHLLNFGMRADCTC